MLILPRASAQMVPPPGSVLDFGHPLVTGINSESVARPRGLIGLWIMNQQSLVTPNLAAGGNKLAGADAYATLSTYSFAGGKAGAGFYCDGSAASRWDFNTNASAGIFENLPQTITVMFECWSATSPSNQWIAGRASASASVSGAYITTSGAGPIQFQIKDGSSNIVFITSETLVNRKTYIATQSYAPFSFNNICALNGRIVGFIDDHTLNWGFQSGQTFRAGQSQDSFWGKFVGIIHAVWIHAGNLTAQEVKWLHAEPFAMVRSTSPLRSYYVFPAPGGLVGDANRTQAVVIA